MPLDPAIPPGKASEMWFTALVRSHSPAHLCNTDEKRPFHTSASSVELDVLHLSDSLDVLHLSDSLVSERVIQHVKLTSIFQCSQVGPVLPDPMCCQSENFELSKHFKHHPNARHGLRERTNSVCQSGLY